MKNAREFVSKQLQEKIKGEWTKGNGCQVEIGKYAVSTIRKAINSCGIFSNMDDCGNMFAICEK